MGLDVVAYQHVELVRALAPEEAADLSLDERNAGLISLYPSEDFPAQADGIVRGIYRTSGPQRHLSFSYSGYNSVRAHLCRQVLGCPPEAVWEAPEKYSGRPLVEMINFSDCEGTIGPKTCAKLAGDLRALIEVEHPRSAASLLFQPWHAIFSLAAGGGAVRFG